MVMLAELLDQREPTESGSQMVTGHSRKPRSRAIDSAVPETETSTALSTRSRLPDCAATTNPGPTKPNAPPKARRIETSAAASNARSRDGSTAASKAATRPAAAFNGLAHAA
jgi:hypothetical protein